MTRAIVLQHTATEGPELVATALATRGIPLDIRALHAGQPVPADVAPGELLVVMGGPMGVGDAGDRRWPFLSPEIDLLRKAIAAACRCWASAWARSFWRPPPARASIPTERREVGWGPVDLDRRPA